jgi:hypothetical protein
MKLGQIRRGKELGRGGAQTCSGQRDFVVLGFESSQEFRRLRMEGERSLAWSAAIMRSGNKYVLGMFESAGSSVLNCIS